MTSSSTSSNGNSEMLRTLYDFEAMYAKTLGFKKNEYFVLIHTTTKHKHWWEVVNEKGESGFIPSNYVEPVTVHPSFFLKFIDTALENLKKKPDDIAKCQLVEKLKNLRPQLELLNGNISPPQRFKNSDMKSSTSKSSLHNIKEEQSTHKCSKTSESTSTDSRVESPTDGSGDNVENRRNMFNVDDEIETSRKVLNNTKIEEKLIEPIQKSVSTDSIKKSIENIHEEVKSEIGKLKEESPPITEQSVYDLIENVRINTQLSHDKSRLAVATIVEGLHELLPASVFPYLSTILSHIQSSLVDNVEIDQTHDASRLRMIFTDLAQRTEDAQQRSWSVHEDESIIKENLTELLQILTNADNRISQHVVSYEQYYFVTTLINYYQMEIRWSIRQLLLQIFGVLCSLDKSIICIMLNSILPGELARDMMANTKNISKLHYSSCLLAMLFSMGEPMPITHYELLNTDFVAFLLDNIEEPPDTDVEDQLPDLLLNVILSFNLQFEDGAKNNPILFALEDRKIAKEFTAKALLLLNRERDPIRIFGHTPAPPHSVIKLFLDLLSRKSTANLFYTNDIKVVIDIIIRNMSDLSPNDDKRKQYIELCRRVMGNTNYQEHKHRIDDIYKCFTKIFCEDKETSKEDQRLLREISHEFPQYFD